MKKREILFLTLPYYYGRYLNALGLPCYEASGHWYDGNHDSHFNQRRPAILRVVVRTEVVVEEIGSHRQVDR